MRITLHNVIFTIITLLAFLVAVMSLRFFNFEIQDILRNKTAELLAGPWYLPYFYTHISFGIIAIVLGPFQFLKKIRSKYLGLHRLIGKVYLISILFGGLAGLIIAFNADGGLVAKIGFGLMAIFWLSTGYMAYKSILNKEIAKHERWMLRNYAVTLSAVSLRLGLLLAVIGVVQFEFIYIVMSWASWILNLLIVEWYISKKIGYA